MSQLLVIAVIAVMGTLVIIKTALVAAGIARCQVTAFEPYQTAPEDVSASVEGTLNCD